MKITNHIFLGIIFSIFLFFLNFNFSQISIVFLSSILIDGDHYVYYILKRRNFNLLKCYSWYIENLKRTMRLPMHERKKIYSGFFLFHGIEILIVLFLLGKFISPIFIWIGVGFSFHFIVDIFDEIKVKGSYDKSSLIYNLFRFYNTRN